MDCCRELLDAMRHNNLVPWRQVYRRGVTVPASITGSNGRLSIKLKRAQRAAGYALVLKNRHTLEDADDALLQFSLNDPSAAAQAQAAMAAQETLYLCPGESMTQALPGWTDQVTLDLRGALASDPSEGAETHAIIVIYELVPTLFTEGC